MTSEYGLILLVGAVAGGLLTELARRLFKKDVPSDARMDGIIKAALAIHDEHAVSKKPYPAHMTAQAKRAYVERELHRRGFKHSPLDLVERIRRLES